MKKAVPFFLQILCFSSIIFGCTSNQQTDQVWQKGNLHTHSFWSDGDDFPEMIIQWYKDHNYQFVAISDHNTLADSERWYALTESDRQHKVLEKYIESFGTWVETKGDTNSTRVRLKTFDEYRGKLEQKDSFLIIRSEEVTSSFEKKPIHINVTNIQEKIEPVRANSVVEVMQKTLDVVNAQREKLGIPMFAHINHPNFGYGISTEDIKQLNGERFFEVYNGHPAVNNLGNEVFDSTEQMWDIINIHYYQQGKPLLLGIATDDSHNYHEFSENKSNTGRGWVMVNAKTLDASSLIKAMETGDFYASTGVKLKTVQKTKKKLSVTVAAGGEGAYEIVFLGYKKGDDTVRELKRVSGTTASYVFQEEDAFVRAKVISDTPKSSPVGTSELQQAWVQPVIVQK